MKSKGWEYQMEGQFLEIVGFLVFSFVQNSSCLQYNETINDLLGKHDFDKKKHEIKHDSKTGSTRVTDINVVALRSASQVRALLTQAQKRRSVAATMVNERSSRSHSVFTLRISGVNVGLGDGIVVGTGERCEGSLNLVDLAGSERLNVSFANGAEKERVKETQAINKSLSALGDVIAALGERGVVGVAGGDGAKHIPYRNSKVGFGAWLRDRMLKILTTVDVPAAKFVKREFEDARTFSAPFALLRATHYLQMFLNLSPLAVHLNESLTSLRFATKVSLI
jgi:kinesin family protein C1